MVRMILSVSPDLGIGCKGDLLYRDKEDLLRFRTLTLDGVVVMGRKTFESLDQKPLEGRYNVVVSGSMSTPEHLVGNKGIIFVKSLEDPELLKILKTASSTWIIGGKSIYEGLMKYVDQVYLTRFLYEPSVKPDTKMERGFLKGFRLVSSEEQENSVYQVYRRK